MDDQVSNLLPEELNRCKRFISTVPWKFATTAAKTNPHWYTLKKVKPEKSADFEWFVLLIRRVGRVEYFWGKPYTVLDIDEWKYWTMGNPLDQTTLINRAYLEGEHTWQLKKSDPKTRRGTW